jgi:hypothetical protein
MKERLAARLLAQLGRVRAVGRQIGGMGAAERQLAGMRTVGRQLAGMRTVGRQLVSRPAVGRQLVGMRAVRQQLGRLTQWPGWPLRSGEEVPRWAVLSAGLAPVVLVGAWLVADSLQPRTYSPIRDTVSVLAGLDGTDRWIMTWALFAICGCYLLTAIGLAGLGLPARLLLIVAGTCSAGIALSPEPSSGPTIAHLAWTGLGGVTIAIWPAVAAWRLQERPLVLSTRPSIAVSVLFVGLLAWVVLETRGGRDLGLAERLDSGVQTCWPFVVALVLRHAARGEAGAEAADRGHAHQADDRDEEWPSDPTCRC